LFIETTLIKPARGLEANLRPLAEDQHTDGH